ncbi:hypothetical protein L0156_20345 [bacterium]|nr:hypothetical protein [bacterium]
MSLIEGWNTPVSPATPIAEWVPPPLVPLFPQSADCVEVHWPEQRTLIVLNYGKRFEINSEPVFAAHGGEGSSYSYKTAFVLDRRMVDLKSPVALELKSIFRSIREDAENLGYGWVEIRALAKNSRSELMEIGGYYYKFNGTWEEPSVLTYAEWQ